MNKEKKLIKKVLKEMKKDGLLKYIALNKIKNEAAIMVLDGSISTDFYVKAFVPNEASHYTENEYWKNFTK